MRSIPVGIQDFRRIREEGRYYVDKTPLIDYIESEYATVAFQFIRPRRFGKSTNLSMIDAYFNLRYRGNSWFDGLMISEIRPDDPEKNDYPVIYLDMKEVGCDSYESFVSDIRLIVSECARSIKSFWKAKAWISTAGACSESSWDVPPVHPCSRGRCVCFPTCSTPTTGGRQSS